MLHAELTELNGQLAEEFSWHTVKEIERVQYELELANRAVFELSEKVRKRWA
jgi:hypothetical protein